MNSTYEYKYKKYKEKYFLLQKQIASNLKGGFIVNNNNDKNKLILFKASWCGHCTKFGPLWEELKENYKNNNDFELMTFDADKDKSEILFYNVKGYPTIFLETKNGRNEYKGDRTKESINSFIKEKTLTN
jgi:protein disulfide-isomerase